MAIQSSFYNTDGTTRTFPSTKHIATKQHCAVYLKLVSDSTWSVVSVSDYELVNNSVVFITAPDTLTYSMVEIRVADSQDELTNSPSDISLVASSIANVDIVATSIDNVNTTATNIANVNAVGLDLLEPVSEINTVATSIDNVNTVGADIANVNAVGLNILDVVSVADVVVPNIAEILQADDNATIATNKATEATNARNYAYKWSSELENVQVNDGVNAVGYSAFHWSKKAEAFAVSINPSTIVNKDSDTGAAYIPSGTTAQRPSSPSAGYMRFNTTLSSAEVWNGTMWTPVGGGATGGGTDTVFVETSYAVTQNYTITAGKSAITVGDAYGNVSIADGISVTVPDGSIWVVQGN